MFGLAKSSGCMYLVGLLQIDLVVTRLGFINVVIVVLLLSHFLKFVSCVI